MIFPHRVKLDLSLDTDVLSRGEEFSPKRHINVGRDSPATFCASASTLSLHDEVVSITQGEPLSMNLGQIPILQFQGSLFRFLHDLGQSLRLLMVDHDKLPNV